MKKILMYRWKAYNYLDIKKHFELNGFWVDEIYQHLESYDVAPEFAEKISDLIKSNTYDFVFTVNYFAVIAEVCHDLGIMYVSWTCDNPLISMYHRSVFYDTNRIFTFDYINYNEFKEMGVKGIDYLPLAVDSGRIKDIIGKAEDISSYTNDISFVGSLYERNSYDRVEPELDDYLRGYLECFIQLQSNMLGESLIDMALDPDILARLSETFSLDKSEGSFSDLGLVFSTTALGFKVARTTRIEALRQLSSKFNVSIYTNSDTEPLPLTKSRGSLDYWSEMPLVFNQSKINLNFTIPNIKSGIPLRVWDIMGSGGFVLTNFQSEMGLYFKEGEDIVSFKSLPELVDKAGFYLEHPEEREKISAKSLEKIQKYHTYTERMKSLLDAL